MVLKNSMNLLASTSNIRKNNILNRENINRDFNIFEITNMITQEVEVCKFIYELISPKGRHYQGAIFLKYFIGDVLHLDIASFSYKEWQSIEVFREYRCVSQRRIDLVIRTSERFIPIEVKLYAQDQEGQCFDYWCVAKRARRQMREVKIYYLTLNGEYPSDLSVENRASNKRLSSVDIECRSFKHDVLIWLKHCLELEQVQHYPDINVLLRQFYIAIRNLIYERVDKMNQNLQDMIISSPQNLMSAYQIAKEFEKIKLKNIYKLFREVKNKIGNKYSCKMKKEDWLIIDSLYQSGRAPGIDYFYTKLDENNELWVRMELDKVTGRFCFGYIMIHNNQRILARRDFVYTDEEILSKTNLEIDELTKYEDDSWLAVYDFSERYPNFKTFDEYYMSIFGNEDEFEIFADSCAEHIEFLLSR